MDASEEHYRYTTRRATRESIEEMDARGAAREAQDADEVDEELGTAVPSDSEDERIIDRVLRDMGADEGLQD